MYTLSGLPRNPEPKTWAVSPSLHLGSLKEQMQGAQPEALCQPPVYGTLNYTIFCSNNTATPALSPEP